VDNKCILVLKYRTSGARDKYKRRPRFGAQFQLDEAIKARDATKATRARKQLNEIDTANQQDAQIAQQRRDEDYQRYLVWLQQQRDLK
jgi:hypothetical protein